MRWQCVLRIAFQCRDRGKEVDRRGSLMVPRKRLQSRNSYLGFSGINDFDTVLRYKVRASAPRPVRRSHGIET